MRLIAWLQQQEPVVLCAVLLVVMGTWGFIELADEVMEGTTQTLDTWIVHVLRQPDRPELPRGPQWLVEVGRDVTALGSYAVLSLVVAAVIGIPTAATPPQDDMAGVAGVGGWRADQPWAQNLLCS